MSNVRIGFYLSLFQNSENHVALPCLLAISHRATLIPRAFLSNPLFGTPKTLWLSKFAFPDAVNSPRY
ncbi:MAG TPA: hypothetical protein DG355_07720 [Candidatus Cloacimonas sp.]|nr:hypothetical protein [Candidatus Cloacimonas sp.]